MNQSPKALPQTTAPWHEPLSRPIDVHRWSDYPELDNCLSRLVAEIEGTEGRHRARKVSSAKRLRDAVRCIVLDLYVAVTADPASDVGIPLGKDRFRRGSRYRALFLTYDSFKAAFDGLVQQGYVQKVETGFRDERTGKGRVTRFRATAKLVELITGTGKLTLARVTYRAAPDAFEPIVLRNNAKEPIEYTDTNYTTRIRGEIERINSHLAQHWVDLYIPDTQMTELNLRMAGDFRHKRRTASSVDFTAKRLRRIFNNEDWSQGGRFYGGWWQNIPKEYRPYIHIDDKRTIEVDYAGMHPVMMYADVGAKLIGDAYDVGLPSVPREIIKVAFNRLVNASGRMAPEPNLTNYGISSADLRARIVTRHQPIARFLGTGHGILLQNLDADIANRIMLRFYAMGYVCLPVHDSFIVHHALEDELRDIMNDEFRKRYGVDIATKTKADGYGDTLQSVPSVVDHCPQSIEAIFAAKGPYSGYETRWNNWNQFRHNLSGS